MPTPSPDLPALPPSDALRQADPPATSAAANEPVGERAGDIRAAQAVPGLKTLAALAIAVVVLAVVYFVIR